MKKASSLVSLMLLLAAQVFAGNETKTADKLFKQKGEYEAALQEYKKVLASASGTASNKAYVNAQIGECYRLSNRIAEAIPFYKAAIDLHYKADSILFQYPFALKAAGQYDEAKAAFKNYASHGGKPARVERAQKEVDNLNKVDEIMKKKYWYEVSNLEAVNTPGSEFGAMLMDDNLYFASTKGTSAVYGATGTPFTNIFSFKIGGDAASVQEVPGINLADRHEASPTISKDGKLMIFARSNDGNRKTHREVCLYMSRFNGSTWSEPELMPINDLDYWNGAPCLSPDGKSLYFASNRKGTKGGLDLYRSKMDESGKWGKPTNLGESVNTPGDESFPMITEDGKLYFSSDGHPSIGGLDIFVATKKGDVTTVENLGTGINTLSDDFGLTLKSPSEGYFSSNRPGGKGDDDIYFFHDGKNDPRIVKFVTKGTLWSKDDKGAEVPVGGNVVKMQDDKGNLIAETTTAEDGSFTFPMDPSKNYVFVAEKEQHLKMRTSFSTVGKSPAYETLTEKETTINLDVKLSIERIKLQQTFVVENINYDYDKWDIRPDAALEIDKIVQFLQDNPSISIELSSHTDSRGDDTYNKKLSQKRAESAKTYIVSKGILATRITSAGYGETKPLIPEAATEEDFQKNRRTEFKIIKIAGAK
jgi:outer membrane protein OmpA-like peptidoglycan-associated protein